MSRITVDGRTADADDDVARYDWAKFSVRIAVAFIIFAQVAFLAWLLSKTWFKNDDLVMLYKTTPEGGFPRSLFHVYSGHLIPGTIGVFWVLRSLFDMAWWPFVVVIAQRTITKGTTIRAFSKKSMTTRDGITAPTAVMRAGRLI